MYIGFNLKKADEMIENIVKEYNGLGIYTAEQWEPLKDTLRKEWIGPDEQNFEQNFVKRLCELYVSSYNLADSCVKTLANLSEQWVEFQRKNTIDGSTADFLDSSISGLLDKIKDFLFGSRLKKDNNIVTFSPANFSQDDNRGLQNATSKTTIQSKVSEFVTSIQNRTKELFNAIETNQAFFGDQASAIKKYIEDTGSAIAEVTTAVKDMNDALETLASSSYTQASSDVTTAYATNSSNMQSNVEQLGSSRWV